jgi:hypothetical protein
MQKGIVLAIMLFSTYCTKKADRWTDEKANTIYDTLTTLPGNRMLSFKIANIIQEEIYSTVNDSTNMVTAYLPWYYTLNFIEPAITVSKDATVTPASGELVQVFAATPVQYSVTGKDARKRMYTLQIIVQQPRLVLNELSTATQTAQYQINSSDITLTGENFITDLNVTKVYLVNAQGNKWPVSKYDNGTERSNRITYVAPGLTNKDNPPPPGLYYIEMQAYSLTARMQYPIELK